MNIYGAGGHAKVIIDCCLANGLSIDNIFDDNFAVNKLLTFSVRHDYESGLLPGELLIIAVGNNSIRKRISEKVDQSFATIIHPMAHVSEYSQVDCGSVIIHGSIVQTNVYIGRHSIVNTKSSIDHDCLIGDFVHIGPGVTICGDVQVGEGAFIGAGAVLIQGVKIGKWATIGAGSVIIKSIPDFAVVVGNPSRIIKYNEQ